MRTKTRLILPVLAAGLLAAGVATAEEGAMGSAFAASNFSGSAALTTDYIFRGISQTDENWAIQGSFDYTHPVGVYLGAWASNVDFGGGIEIDAYGGFANEVAGFSYDLGLLYYMYPKANEGSDPELDYLEIYAKVGYTFADVPLEPALGASYYYSPDYTGEDDASNCIAGSLGLTLPYGFSFSGDLGYIDVEGDKSVPDGYDYLYYRLGLGYSVVGFDLDLSFHNTDDLDEFGDDDDLWDERFVFTISRSL